MKWFANGWLRQNSKIISKCVTSKKYIKKEDIQPTKQVLQMWNKSELKQEGTCHMTICNPRNQRKYSVEFIVVREDFTPLLGAKVIQQMGLIDEHKENFEKLATGSRRKCAGFPLRRRT